MSQVAHNAQHEFWRPPAVQASAPAPGLVEACDSCGTEFMIGSRFCHICGTGRQPQAAPVMTNSWTSHLEFQNIQQSLGLSTASLVAFLMGVACVLGALFCGLIYSERNVLEWEAVQMFRIQWLLGSSAAFVAGILLKKASK